MNSPQELDHEGVLRVKLEVLRQKHRDLDEAIAALQEQGALQQLTIQRLKKEKLRLKDQISRIEDELTPDIIA
ncbi:YdcH family protein [Roseinatronobacter sp.]|uniref:YdcH family protein n=1 Tax=Roseinatronobacter sp. TaxID=1945755 RepID=UPI003F70567C